MAKKWTKQEDDILVKLIEKGKLPKAIKETSASLGRSEGAIYQRCLILKRYKLKLPTNNRYTKEEEKIILDYVMNPENTDLSGLYSQLKRSRSSIGVKLFYLRKKYPEIRDFTPENFSSKIEVDKLKQTMIEEISKNKHNLQQAFRNVAEKTGISPGTIEYYWYGGKRVTESRKQLNRKEMPALFYTSDSKGASKNEKNSNVIQVSKGKYLFNMITSWLNNKFKVKSTTKKK